MQGPRPVLILSGRIRSKFAQQLCQLRMSAQCAQVQGAAALQVRLAHHNPSLSLLGKEKKNYYVPS